MTSLDLALLPEVEIPPGDPEALREAARTYEGSAEQARQVGTQVRRTAHGTVGAHWSGAASAAFLGRGEHIASGHDHGTRVLQEGAGAITQYAHRLEQAQQLARRAQQATTDYNRRATQLRTQQEAVVADPAAQAHMAAQAEQLAADRSQAASMDSEAHVMARQAAQRAAGAFGAVAQGAIALAWPGTAPFLAPKAVIDSLLGLRKEVKLFQGVREAIGLAGSTDEALARWLGLGGRLGRFGSVVKWIGKRAPAVGVGFGLYQMVAPGSSAGERLMGGVTAAGSGVLTASAFGAYATGAATANPVIGAAALAGVAGYQLYKHREAIGKGLSKAWDATSSGVTKAAKWTGDKLGDARDWTVDRASDAASAVKNGVGNAAQGFAHGVTKGTGAIADAFGF